MAFDPSRLNQQMMGFQPPPAPPSLALNQRDRVNVQMQERMNQYQNALAEFTPTPAVDMQTGGLGQYGLRYQPQQVEVVNPYTPSQQEQAAANTAWAQNEANNMPGRNGGGTSGNGIPGIPFALGHTPGATTTTNRQSNTDSTGRANGYWDAYENAARGQASAASVGAATERPKAPVNPRGQTINPNLVPNRGSADITGAFSPQVSASAIAPPPAVPTAPSPLAGGFGAFDPRAALPQYGRTAEREAGTAPVTGALPSMGIGGNFTVPKTASRTGAGILNAAKQWIGVPYQWGGTNPNKGLDCSGLTMNAAKSAGMRIPRTAAAQYGYFKGKGKLTTLANARPGDLLYFRSSGGNGWHTGVYVGGGKMLHAPSTGKRVSITSLGNYYTSRFLGAGRVGR